MNTHVVLCVDDEENILASLRRLLRREPYELLTCASATEALDLLGRRTVQLVISDQRMPDMSGVRFFQHVKTVQPDTVRVILSGYADAALIVEAINQGEVYRFLAKPWNDEELKTAIQQCLAHHDLLRENRELLRQVQDQNAELGRLNAELARTVEDRTESLQLSQAILHHLPVAVIGVSAEGMIVLINAAAEQRFATKRGIVLGDDIEEALPETSCAAIRHCLASGEPVRDTAAPGGDATLVVSPLKKSGIVVGCIVTWEGGER